VLDAYDAGSDSLFKSLRPLFWVVAVGGLRTVWVSDLDQSVPHACQQGARSSELRQNVVDGCWSAPGLREFRTGRLVPGLLGRMRVAWTRRITRVCRTHGVTSQSGGAVVGTRSGRNPGWVPLLTRACLSAGATSLKSTLHPITAEGP
jgi:hypothetical protein